MAQDGKNKKHFFKDFKAELKKVIWPTPKQLVNGTVAVITIVLIVAVIVFVLDLTFDLFNKYGVNKLKEAVDKSQSTVTNEVPAEENATNTNTENVAGTDANTVSNENVE